MTRRGRKLTAAARGAAALQDDRRAPVVYLRSFSADDESARVVISWALLRPAYYTDEEQLATVLNEIGPFVAIGDPRESLPDLGATRIYVGGDDWQARVTDLVSRAALVIMRAGTYEGFWWEFGLVRASVRPERLLLLIPDHKAEYERFREKAAELMPSPLPACPRGARVLSKTRAIVAFEANWRSWVLPVVSSFRRAGLRTPFATRTKLTLKPVFERLGVPYTDSADRSNAHDRDRHPFRDGDPFRVGLGGAQAAAVLLHSAGKQRLPRYLNNTLRKNRL